MFDLAWRFSLSITLHLVNRLYTLLFISQRNKFVYKFLCHIPFNSHKRIGSNHVYWNWLWLKLIIGFALNRWFSSCDSCTIMIVAVLFYFLVYRIPTDFISVSAGLVSVFKGSRIDIYQHIIFCECGCDVSFTLKQSAKFIATFTARCLILYEECTLAYTLLKWID